jgi:hypothetical protein
MNRMVTALAAALGGACALVCAPALAQQPASPPATVAPRAPAQAAPSAPGSREPTGARAAHPPPVYRVELVVFRATSALGAPEDWAVEAGTAPVTSTDADPGAAAESARPNAGGATPSGAEASAAASSPNQTSSALPSSVLRLLPSSEFDLDGVAARLRASGRYVPVAHFAWAQNASPWGTPVEIPVQSVGLDAQGITGNVALERGVYLHLVLDLRYAMSDPPAGLDAPPGTVFVLDESHRVRLKERNYFDHPAFGVIALVTPDAAPGRRSGPAPRADYALKSRASAAQN